MRRITGLVLLGLAGFLVAMAAMVKFYAYPTLAVVPIDQHSVSYVAGDNVTYFSKANLREETGRVLTTVNVIGQVAASKAAGSDVAVWEKTSASQNDAGDVLSASDNLIAFDRNTGEAVDCCNTTADGKPQTYQGQLVKFPFNTQKQAYPYWDDTLKRTVPFVYSGEEKIDGLNTYKFTQSFAPVKVGTVAVPSRVLGLPAGQMITCDSMYGNTRTYWVEPETGVMIKVQEQPNSTIAYQGQDKLIATKGTVESIPSDIAKSVKDYEGKASQLHLLRVMPLWALLLGLLCAVVGVLLVLSAAAAARRNDSPTSNGVNFNKQPAR